ncbi:hypothetical protein [Acidovorax sp. BL-A-41-H1]|uniref:hypothetical protein n=1 Tax=Acidovorax sp. BL-A-41-H1 TaxID=3421102 RepID=UPI003F7B1C5D
MSNLSQFFAGGEPPYWVSGSTYSQGRIVRSPADQQRYVRIVAGAGTTDPSADSTNWRPDGMSAIKSIQRGVLSASGAASATATISSVNVSKSILIDLGQTASGTGVNVCARLELTNSTTLTATRASAASDTAVSWQLVEYF